MNEDVARIIGWSKLARPFVVEDNMRHLYNAYWMGPDGRYYVDAHYAADDLAAWIRNLSAASENRDDWAFGWDGEKFFGFALWNSHLSGHSEEGGGWEISVEDPTILGCLEQLVIQIGASS